MIRINKIISKMIKNVGIDKITHFFAGATIALSVTLILCLIGSISKVIPYSILGIPISPVPWLWDRIYHRPHTFNTDKFTFVDFL